MKTNKYNYLKIIFFFGLILITVTSCERERTEGTEFATLGTNPEVYIDGFSGGLEYYPYADSQQEAFSVDTETKYSGTSSMRFDVPNVGDARGAYAGAIFRDDNGGRDLSGYDALTFWAKATKAAKLNDIGFGQDFGENKFEVSKKGLQLSTNWVKYIIPIPNASVLNQEQGMFWYAEGPEGEEVIVNGDTFTTNPVGYTFWIDELKYEKLGTLGQKRPFIKNGEDASGVAFVGEKLSIDGVGVTFNMPNGTDDSFNISPNYFNFLSSDASVATATGAEVNLISGGSTTITAELGGDVAQGSFEVNSTDVAPIPTNLAADVISIFSDSYTNEPVDYFNGYWAPFQTTQGQDDIDVNGNKIIKYTQLNFVGTEFQGSKTIDASLMTHFHLDVLIESTLKPGDFLTVKLQDLGADNVFGGGNDRAGEIRFTASSSIPLVNGSWVSIDVPLSSFISLSTRANLAQLVYVTDATVTSIFVDNIYFYKQ